MITAVRITKNRSYWGMGEWENTTLLRIGISTAPGMISGTPAVLKYYERIPLFRRFQ
jgi:hypothetical protein